MKSNALFVCIHNSARSQMAESFLRALAPNRFDVYSAGLSAGTLNAYVVHAMKEIGFDLAANVTKTVFDPSIKNRDYEYVFTVCQESDAEQCPIVPTKGKRIHWSFDDPSKFTGSRDEIMKDVRRVRDEIRRKVEAWYASLPAAEAAKKSP